MNIERSRVFHTAAVVMALSLGAAAHAAGCASADEDLTGTGGADGTGGAPADSEVVHAGDRRALHSGIIMPDLRTSVDGGAGHLPRAVR